MNTKINEQTLQAFIRGMCKNATDARMRQEQEEQQAQLRKLKTHIATGRTNVMLPPAPAQLAVAGTNNQGRAVMTKGDGRRGQKLKLAQNYRTAAQWSTITSENDLIAGWSAPSNSMGITFYTGWRYVWHNVPFEDVQLFGLPFGLALTDADSSEKFLTNWAKHLARKYRTNYFSKTFMGIPGTILITLQ